MNNATHPGDDRPMSEVPMLACPECGGTNLRIAATILAVVDGHDMSADTNQSDVEWDKDSYAECRSVLGDGDTSDDYCDWDGIVDQLVKGD